MKEFAIQAKNGRQLRGSCPLKIVCGEYGKDGGGTAVAVKFFVMVIDFCNCEPSWFPYLWAWHRRKRKMRNALYPRSKSGNFSWNDDSFRDTFVRSHDPLNLCTIPHLIENIQCNAKQVHFASSPPMEKSNFLYGIRLCFVCAENFFVRAQLEKKLFKK